MRLQPAASAPGTTETVTVKGSPGPALAPVAGEMSSQATSVSTRKESGPCVPQMSRPQGVAANSKVCCVSESPMGDRAGHAARDMPASTHNVANAQRYMNTTSGVFM